MGTIEHLWLHIAPQQISNGVNSGDRAGQPKSSPQKTNRTGNICIKMFMYILLRHTAET